MSIPTFKKSQDTKPYDLEININSFSGISKGWEITFNGEEGKQNYEEARENNVKIFSVIGNKNRGKSFLLSKISGRPIKNGFIETTKGLSLSYPKNCNNMLLLDSVGFESPILECESEDYRFKIEGNPEETEKFYKELENLKKSLEESKNFKEKRKIEFRLNKLKSDFDKKILNKNEQIEKFTNERKITDFFLQRFIIESADVLLLVVGKLTIEDQFFLNKITKLIKENKKFLQKIIVVHNLYLIKNKKDIEDYIENILKKSYTFKVTESTIKIEGKNEPYNKTFYIEETTESENHIEINHIVMANDDSDSEAGNYYNDSCFQFIKNKAKLVRNFHEFDLESRLKNFLSDISKKIIKGGKSINPEDVEFTENKIKLKKEFENFELNTFYGNIIGETIGEKEFEPNYEKQKDENNIIIYVETPGETTIEKNDIKIDYIGEKTIIDIKGNRQETERKETGMSFPSGPFNLKINLSSEDGQISDKNGDIKIEKKDKIGFTIIKIKKIK